MMEDVLKKCTMCPHECKVNRYETVGKCKQKYKIKMVNLPY